MMQSSGNASPGWYPVPGGERYWDGSAWTENFRQLPPPPAPPSDDAAPAVAATTPDATGSWMPPGNLDINETDALSQPSFLESSSAPTTASLPAAGKKPRTFRTVFAVVASIVLLLAGGGAVAFGVHQHQVSESHKRAADEARAAAAKRKAEAAAAKAAKLKRERHTFQACRQELGPLYNSLESIDSRLDVGLTQADLGSAVGEASIAYHRIHVHALEGACLSAGAKMEDAFNQYATTSSKWNACITDFYCDTDSITPGMQQKWAAASRDLREAQHLMQELNPDSPQFNPDATTTLGT